MHPEISSSPLPTELWIKVVGGLPAHYQRSCLSVSKLFHDVSVPFVFASINVRLGLVRDNFLAHDSGWLMQTDEEGDKTEAAIRRSCELLQHTVCSPGSSIAQAVRYVSVRAYSLYGKSPPSELMDALDEALSVLRLRGFAWHGCHPMPRPQTLEALRSASGETLEDITLPPGLLDHTPIQRLGYLRSLSFLNRYAACYKYPGDLWAGDDDSDDSGDNEDEISQLYDSDSMSQTIASASMPLHSLSVFSDVLLKCNMQRLSTLAELTLALITDADADADPLEQVLLHCSQLRSLTLLLGDDYSGDVPDTLNAHPDALPLLTAFRFSDPSMYQTRAEGVASFLRKKALLERLEIGHHSSTSSFDDIQPILDILPGFPRLRVLGWELCGYSRPADSRLNPDLLQYLSAHIPHQLTALSLWVSARSRSTVKKDDWIQFFRGLPACRFIHVLTNYEFFGTRTLQAALLDHPPPLAELVGFNEDIAWVERDPETGRVGYSKPWPRSKVYNRTVEEFGCEEWEWLLKPMDMRLMA